MNNRSIHWWSGAFLVFLQILAGSYLLWKSSQQDLATSQILVVLSTLLVLSVVIVLFANRVQWNMMVRAIDAAFDAHLVAPVTRKLLGKGALREAGPRS